MNPILLAVLIVTVIGLIGAVILVAASIFMYVPVDERVEQITGCLPGANCGGCGCAGCADYAKTIVEDGNAVNKCVPGGAAFDAIHVVDGVALVDREKCTGCGACAKACPNAIISIIPEHKRKPVVLCQNKDKGAQTRKACSAGCIGCMKCAKACPKQAITVENNLAYIDQEKCVGCGLCAKECPVGVIHVPAAYAQQVMSPAQEEAPAANA